MSPSKVSGNPEDFPSHSRPESWESGALRLVGPSGCGVDPGVKEPEAYVEAEAEKEGEVVSVGKIEGSLILPNIHFCTRLIY